MATTTNFKKYIDKAEWRPLANAPTASAAGSSLAFDLRNSVDRHPSVFLLSSAALFHEYNALTDGWITHPSPALAGTFGAGACAVFVPTRAAVATVRGDVTLSGSSHTTTKIVGFDPGGLGVNTLANRGDGMGLKVRVVGCGAGSSGTISESYVVASTDSTAATDTLYLDPPLSFTPKAGDRIEFQSGIVYVLGAGTTAAGSWKAFDLLTRTWGGNLSTTNLPATISADSVLIARDELYVPADKTPGDGFFGQMTATAIASTTITGTAAGADAAVLTNEWRNFQIRITEDTAIPTAVGQRAVITSHTAGPSPVYTVPTWAVTPSATAKFVIEHNNEILLFTSAVATVYTYSQAFPFNSRASGNTDTWSSTLTAARAAGTLAAGGMCVLPLVATTVVAKDGTKNFRYSQILGFRGGATTTMDVLDLAGAAAGSWTSAQNYLLGPTWTTGACLAYDSASNDGRYAYISASGGQQFFRLDVFSRILIPWAPLRFTQGAATVGEKLAALAFVDGATKVGVLVTQRQTAVEMFDCVILA